MKPQCQHLLIPEREALPSDQIYVELYQKEGELKRPVLLMIPGGPGGDHAIYKSQVEAFIPYVDIVLMDPRGCGRSAVSSPQAYSMDAYIEDVESVRQQLGLERFLLLGTSYGSMVAQGYAIKYGESVLDGLILVAGAPSYEFIDDASSKLSELGNPE